MLSVWKWMISKYAVRLTNLPHIYTRPQNNSNLMASVRKWMLSKCAVRLTNLPQIAAGAGSLVLPSWSLKLLFWSQFPETERKQRPSSVHCTDDSWEKGKGQSCSKRVGRYATLRPEKSCQYEIALDWEPIVQKKRKAYSISHFFNLTQERLLGDCWAPKTSHQMCHRRSAIRRVSSRSQTQTTQWFTVNIVLVLSSRSRWTFTVCGYFPIQFFQLWALQSI